ncbi:MAG TPA: DUF433 domain-containing protein [Planctomycetota bacterium]|nr:DUF433 domain-containing protein [Planctomycetota bacterium]
MSDLASRIVVNAAVMAGKPVVRGTRVTVERVLSLLAQGLPTPELLKEYPQLVEDDIRACLAYGASLAGHEEIVPLPESRSA